MFSVILVGAWLRIPISEADNVQPYVSYYCLPTLGGRAFGSCKERCCEHGHAETPKSGSLCFFSVYLGTCLPYHTVLGSMSTTTPLSTGNVPSSLCSCQQCQRINILCIFINSSFIVFCLIFFLLNSNYPECEEKCKKSC